MSLLFSFFLVAVLTSFVATPMVIRIAHKVGALDHPEERKVHRKPMPRLGGLAIFMSFIVTGAGSFFFWPQAKEALLTHRIDWILVLSGATLVFLLGVWDDIRPLGAGPKFLIQAVAGVMALMSGLSISVLSNPFGGAIELGWWGIPLTIVWVVGVTNAFNLIDGLDGLASGVAFISTSAVFVIALFRNQREVEFLAVVLAGGLLGFLWFNFNPAKIFLGDSGAFFLGYLLAILSMSGSQKSTTALAIMIPIMIVGIPVFDTLFAMLRRAFREIIVNRNFNFKAIKMLFIADREHLHHTLLDMGFTHRKVVILIYMMSLVMAAFALTAFFVNNDRLSLVLLFVGIAIYFFVKSLRRAHVLDETHPGLEDKSQD